MQAQEIVNRYNENKCIVNLIDTCFKNNTYDIIDDSGEDLLYFFYFYDHSGIKITMNGENTLVETF